MLPELKPPGNKKTNNCLFLFFSTSNEIDDQIVKKWRSLGAILDAVSSVERHDF